MIVAEGRKCKQTSGKYSFEKCNPAKREGEKEKKAERDRYFLRCGEDGEMGDEEMNKNKSKLTLSKKHGAGCSSL